MYLLQVDVGHRHCIYMTAYRSKETSLEIFSSLSSCNGVVTWDPELFWCEVTLLREWCWSCHMMKTHIAGLAQSSVYQLGQSCFHASPSKFTQSGVVF